MAKPCLILWLATFFSMPCTAQIIATKEVIIDSASNSFCNQDTASTIRYLETYLQQYPEGSTATLVTLRLAKFYIAAKRTAPATALLKRGLQINRDHDWLAVGRDSCKLLSHPTRWLEAKSSMCVLLSQLSMGSSNPREALEYLTLADTKYLPPYGGCLNGMIMYKTYLSIYFADVYLYMGDTTSAINRLFTYMMHNESYAEEAAVKLKGLLLLKYNTKQIKKEVTRSIAHIQRNRIKKGNEEEKYFQFSIFSIQPFVVRLESLKDSRRFLKQHRPLKMLYN